MSRSISYGNLSVPSVGGCWCGSAAWGVDWSSRVGRDQSCAPATGVNATLGLTTITWRVSFASEPNAPFSGICVLASLAGGGRTAALDVTGPDGTYVLTGVFFGTN